jgi:hypothetical protein
VSAINLNWSKLIEQIEMKSYYFNLNIKRSTWTQRYQEDKKQPARHQQGTVAGKQRSESF